jgi:flagellar assembly factor FliW
MPFCDSARFGRIEYSDSETLVFPFGLPGFEHETRFLPLQPAGMAPLVFLQSLENPSLCFVTAPVEMIDPDYRVLVSAEDQRRLGYADTSGSPSDLMCLAILCDREGVPPTANLLGPIVVRRDTRMGLQAIRDDRRYSAWHPLAVAEAQACS